MTGSTPSRWTGTAAQLLGAVVLATRIAPPVFAYPIMLVGSILWLIVGLGRRDWALVALNGGYSAINIAGIVAWGVAHG